MAVVSEVKLLAHRAGLPGDVDSIRGSAFLPAPAHWQEGGASSRLARDTTLIGGEKAISLVDYFLYDNF
jgi:hypothetical protein